MCWKKWTRVVVEGVEGAVVGGGVVGGGGDMGILDLAPAGCGGRAAGSSPVGLVMLSYGGACGREIGLCKLPENFGSSFFFLFLLGLVCFIMFFSPRLFSFFTNSMYAYGTNGGGTCFT